MLEGCLRMFAGMRMLLLEPALRAVLWRMLILLFSLLVGEIYGVYALTEYLGGLLTPAGDAWYWRLLGWLAGWLTGLMAVVLALLCGFVSFTALAAIAVSPWLEMLAERVEIRVAGRALTDPRGMMQMVAQSISHAVRPLLGLIVPGLIALVVVWLPLVGSIAASLIWGWAGIRFLNFELMDVPASRRGWDFAARKRELVEKRFFWLGFGGTAMVLMLIPGLNTLVLPAAVVALSEANTLSRGVG